MADEKYNDGPDQVIPVDDVWTSDIRAAVKIRQCGDPNANTPPISVPTLLRQVAETWPKRKALCVKRDGKWQSWTFQEYHQLVRTAAKSFIKLGLQPFQGVAIMGCNSPEYFISNMGAIMAGGISSGLYLTSSPATCQYYINNIDVAVAVVDCDYFLQKLLKVRDQCPNLNTIVQCLGKPTTDGVLTWDGFMSLADGVSDEQLEMRMKGIAINRCASVIYTSGTTGVPKGVMISHDMFTWMGRWGVSVIDLRPGHDIYVSYMPLAHAAAATVDMFTMLSAGATVHFAQPDAYQGSLLGTLCEVRPTVFLASPQMYEVMFQGLNSVLGAGGMQAALVNMCRSDAASQWKNAEKDAPRPAGLGSWFSNKLLNKVRSKMGLQDVRHAVCTGAPLSVDVLNYMHSINLPVHEMFGMSETMGPCAFNRPGRFKPGSIGVEPRGSEFTIFKPDDTGLGELVYRGRNVFMGYVGLEDETRRVIDADGWYHTGDAGRRDDDGFFSTVGRLKEVITLGTGERVFPNAIEDRIRSQISIFYNILAVGEGRKHISVLFGFKVHVDPTTIGATDMLLPEAKDWLANHGVTAATVTEALQYVDKFEPTLQRAIDTANEGAESASCRVLKWAILPRALCMHLEELTATVIPRRYLMLQKYKTLIDGLYVEPQ